MDTHTITGAELKERGQAASVEDVSEQQWAAFRAALETVEDGAEFTVNDIRDHLDAAGIPYRARGGMFNRAIVERRITPLEVHKDGRVWKAFDASTGVSAHAAQVRVYVRGALLVGAL